MRRRQEVREYMKLGYKKWAKKVKYGLRWAIEGTFSSIKSLEKTLGREA